MNRIFIAIILLIAVCCRNTENDVPDLLKKPIDLFFLENHNEEVLAQTSKILLNPTSFDISTMALLLKAGAYCELGKQDSSKAILQGVDTFNIQKSAKLRFWYNTINGLYLYRTNKYSEAFITLSSNLSESYDERATALCLRLLARIHYASGDVNKASEWIAKSTGLYKKFGLVKSVAINHKIIGRYFASKNDLRDAEKYFSIAENGLLQSNDSLELFYIYINHLDLQLRLNNLKKAEKYAARSEKFISKNTDNQALALLYNNLGEIKYKQKDYKSSLMFYNKTLNLPLGYFTDLLRCGNAYIAISKIYSEQNDMLNAMQYAKQALELSQKADIKILQFNANNQLASLYEKSNNYAQAYNYQQDAKAYLEEIDEVESKNSETIYNATINMVRLENEAFEMKGEKRFYLFMIIAGIVFTVFLLIYGITTYRLMISRNQVLKSLVKKNLQLIDDERKLNEALHIELSTKKLTRKSTDEDKDQLLYNELTDWLQQGKQFLRKDLTAEIVARELGTNREYLSRAVSSQQLHFNELINKYRIEEAVKILSNKCDKRHKYNLNIIASDVGFKSMSVFIEAFRKQTGLNPAQFRSTACSDEKVEDS